MEAQKISPSHIALLVPSVRKAAAFLRRFGLPIGKEEEWDGEGTREIYVGFGQTNSLLLMEPAKPGAYRRAMEKRGPGLHHIAIDVLHLDQLIQTAQDGGWALHPASTSTIAKTRTAWFYRKGFPALIEVQERETLQSAPLFVRQLNLPASSEAVRKLLPSLGISTWVSLAASELSVDLGTAQPIRFRDLL
jgi:hypothetical protein